ncbi:dynein regulatory complex subunit 2-like [Cydia pomonella]|uniref:dynein regulatory complex subunit 2-like n=1 Tax=Cydia pomonella TaxID=82600 RepID=UPI002ADDAA29|nr:dynein regulatory complex subunit 2-like [Cydia pomonella]
MGMTPEEKKAKKEAKKQAKLAADAEKRRKMKNIELRREIASQLKNRDALDRQYRALMAKIKEPEFRKEMEVMWRTFERAYDKKDHQLSHIMNLMNVADDQFQRTVASFCDTIDTMINKFLTELEEMTTQNNLNTTNLLKSGEGEADDIMKDHNTAETHLQLLLYTGHKEADTQVWTKRGENLVKEDEERTKFANIRENLRSYLENNYNNMWDDYKSVLKAYVSETAENQKQVRKLRRKENTMADVIASQGKRIANSDGLLKRLRTELAAYESGTKQAVFRDRRDRHRAACQKLKQRMINGVNLDTNLLAVLVSASDSTLEWLSAAHKKGEKILRMAALCRKFETQREKVLPYGTEQPHSPTQTVRKQHSDDSLVINAISTTCGMTRMWQRVAKAEMTKRALMRERELLLQENDMIEKKLKSLKRQNIEPKTGECLCSKNTQNKEVFHPNAVEGALEAVKIMKFNAQYK